MVSYYGTHRQPPFSAAWGSHLLPTFLRLLTFLHFFHVTLPFSNLISFIYFASFSSRILPLRNHCLPILDLPPARYRGPEPGGCKRSPTVTCDSRHSRLHASEEGRVDASRSAGASTSESRHRPRHRSRSPIPLSGGGQEHASRDHSRGLSPEP